MIEARLHTPGPWSVGPYFDNDGSPELIVEHQTPHGNLVVAVALPGIVGQHANAQLIAAAPDLLAALEKFIGYHVKRNVGDHHLQEFAIPEALAAIARATGKAGAA